MMFFMELVLMVYFSSLYNISQQDTNVFFSLHNTGIVKIIPLVCLTGDSFCVLFCDRDKWPVGSDGCLFCFPWWLIS